MKAKRIINAKSLFLAAVFIFLSSVMPVSWAQSDHAGNPEQIVGDLQSALIQSMQEGNKMTFQARFDFLRSEIIRTHNFDMIIRAVLGRNWDQLDQEQQIQIADAFIELSIATYASQFNEYEGEHFKIDQQLQLPRDQQLVRSIFTKSDGGTVDFDYVLQEGEDGWQVINIIVDGVSDLALKRTEYRNILQRDGFSALLDQLKEKILLAENG